MTILLSILFPKDEQAPFSETLNLSYREWNIVDDEDSMIGTLLGKLLLKDNTRLNQSQKTYFGLGKAKRKRGSSRGGKQIDRTRRRFL